MVGVTPKNVMSFKTFSHKLIIRKQNKHYAGFCSKLFKVSTTSVTLPEKHVKHAPESENLRGSGLPQLPLDQTVSEGALHLHARIAERGLRVFRWAA